MNDKIAREILLNSADISDQQLQQLLGTMLTPAITMADIFLQSVHHESWSLEDGIVKGGSFSVDRGAGIRAVSGEKTGFAYCNDIVLSALTDAAHTACSIASHGGGNKQQIISNRVAGHQLYMPDNPLVSLTEHEKVALLKELDRVAREQDARVKQVMVNLAGAYEVILVLASDGDLAADVRPLMRLNVSVIVEENGHYERGTAGGGGRSGYQPLLENDVALNYAREAVRVALVNLRAVPAPAGAMPVVLGAGWPAVLLHEAIGHGLEGDFNRKGSSAFAGRLGERVATDVCTVVDDGSLPGALRGSLNIDDEGTPTQHTVLIENGILKGYMQDKLNASLMGVKSTGNGRRESYAHIPIPRMTNTYMLPGQYSQQELIASVDKGIYAANFSGGQVDITSGKFVFSTSEAYLIEHGKLTQPIKGATLVGDGPTVLNKVSLVADDLQFDSGVGTCGKDGQGVPVGVGQPSLKIDELIVGGTC